MYACQKGVQRGMTLVELMIVLAILTVVVAMAIPSYNQYVVRSNRSEAIEALFAAAACQERIFVRTLTYDADSCESTTNNGFYSIVVTTTDSDGSFTVTAQPLGSQTKDGCGSLALTNTGSKTAAGQSGDFAKKCWSGKFGSGGSS